MSFLLLLGIAMPLKYLAHEPGPVKWVGWAHGALFVAYVLAVAHVAFVERWNLWTIGLALLASLLPFGPWIFERKVLRSAPLPAEE